MQTTKSLFRQWCKNCNDFTLHQRIYKTDVNHELYSSVNFSTGKDFASICECGCEYTDMYIKDIDKEKLQEQRLRFKAQRSEKFRKRMNSYLMVANPLEALFNQDFGMRTIVNESDAGLLDEEEQQRLYASAEKKKRNEELLVFKNVGRNDVCLCGSNLKYKKCCLIKHNRY